MSDDRGARAILIASNRGPVSFEPDDEGELQAKRGTGGLVTALTGALQVTGGLWIAAAMSDGDRQQAASSPDGRIEVLSEDAKYDVRYLTPAEDVFERYYNVVSNRILWFLHHYLWDTVRSPRFGSSTRQAWDDYIRVNELFADALAEEGAKEHRPPVYLIHDYHLTLTPSMLRKRQPDASIAHFSRPGSSSSMFRRILALPGS